MRIQSNFKICSICLKEKELTFEHIIPESIGGILESDIQCSDCNNRKLGSKLVSKAKRTYTIRLAINYLKNNLPKLFNKIEKGQVYIARKNDNTITEAVLKNGKIKSKAEKADDGSINVDRQSTDKKLREILGKEGLSKEEIENKLDEFKKIEVDKQHKLTDSITVIKRKFFSWFQKPSEAYMDERVIALIAYNYLCMVIGEIIIDSRMNFLREFILDGTKTDNLIIDQIPYTNKYAPYHKIFSEPGETEIKVTIVLFGSIISFVTVKNLSVPKEYNWILVQDLEERSVMISESFEAVKKREIYKA
ncbi:MAG: HNH endonuclease [Ignavibacteriaceae bacterium]|nr:HNH endonuclease [Ignavibacteriaceae bacterium]